MDNIKKIIKKLEHRGFVLKLGSGSRGKLIPPQKDLPFYSVHLDNSGNLFYPLKRFARKHWSIDLEKL